MTLLLADSALFSEGYNTLTLWLPNLASMLNGQQQLGDPVITANQVQAVDDFLTHLAAAGSPALQQTISDERANLPDPATFVGLTMSQARTVVLGSQTVYLPLMTRSGSGLLESQMMSPTPVVRTPEQGICVVLCLFFNNMCN